MGVSQTFDASTASLYVGNLHPDVTDDKLFDAFSEFKSLASARVCRDVSTDRSLSYGYVNFGSFQDAIHAVEAMNHSVLNGKVIRVMWSNRNPEARKSGIGNVFVKNLNESIDSRALEDIFRKFGNVLSCKVATSDDGKSKRYGFAQFDSEDSATAAIEKLNGSTIGDKQIYVGKFVKRNDRVLANPDAKYTNLYVKNLDPEVSEDLLKEKFSAFGKVSSLVISKDEKGISRGFGFINFENSDDAKRAVESLNGSQLGSKTIYIARAQKKSEREQILHQQFEAKRKEKILKFKGSNVYVKNIKDDVTEDEVRELFGQYGTIMSLKIMVNDEGVNKGFGFVCFTNPEEANRAVNALHGYMFHQKPLYVAIAQRKEDRETQLKLQFAQQLARIVGPLTAFFPGGYSPVVYTSGVISQPLGWRANTFAPSLPLLRDYGPHISNAPEQPKQSRGKMNGQFVAPPKTIRNQQVKQVPNGHPHETNKASGASSAAFNSVREVSHGSQMLCSTRAACPSDQQKQILGEHLYHLVEKHKPELAAKITGMLLEMDFSELLLLMESPDYLAAKVEEAVQVLNEDTISYSSAEVAVN